MLSVLTHDEAKPRSGPDSSETMNLSSRREAYARLIEQHQAALLRAAWRFCRGNGDLAQDLVQETLICGYEAYLNGRFSEGTNARAWLMKILTNVFLQHYRRQRRHTTNVDMDTLIAEGTSGTETLLASPEDRPDMALLSTTLAEPLERALASLSEEMRVCVTLIDIEEMSYAEVAEAMGIPVGTVRSRLFRARQQLHTLLKEYVIYHRRC